MSMSPPAPKLVKLVNVTSGEEVHQFELRHSDTVLEIKLLIVKSLRIPAPDIDVYLPRFKNPCPETMLAFPKVGANSTIYFRHRAADGAQVELKTEQADGTLPVTKASDPTKAAPATTCAASVPTPPVASLPTSSAASVPTEASGVPTEAAPLVNHANVPTSASVPTEAASAPTEAAPLVNHANVPTSASVPTEAASVPTHAASGPTAAASVPTEAASFPTHAAPMVTPTLGWEDDALFREAFPAGDAGGDIFSQVMPDTQEQQLQNELYQRSKEGDNFEYKCPYKVGTTLEEMERAENPLELTDSDVRAMEAASTAPQAASVPTHAASVPTSAASVPTEAASVPKEAAPMVQHANVPTSAASGPTYAASVPTHAAAAKVPLDDDDIAETVLEPQTQAASFPTYAASVSTYAASVLTHAASDPTGAALPGAKRYKMESGQASAPPLAAPMVSAIVPTDAAAPAVSSPANTLVDDEWDDEDDTYYHPLAEPVSTEALPSSSCAVSVPTQAAPMVPNTSASSVATEAAPTTPKRVPTEAAPMVSASVPTEAAQVAESPVTDSQVLHLGSPSSVHEFWRGRGDSPIPMTQPRPRDDTPDFGAKAVTRRPVATPIRVDSPCWSPIVVDPYGTPSQVTSLGELRAALDISDDDDDDLNESFASSVDAMSRFMTMEDSQACADTQATGPTPAAPTATLASALTAVVPPLPLSQATSAPKVAASVPTAAAPMVASVPTEAASVPTEAATMVQRANVPTHAASDPTSAASVPTSAAHVPNEAAPTVPQASAPTVAASALSDAAPMVASASGPTDSAPVVASVATSAASVPTSAASVPTEAAPTVQHANVPTNAASDPTSAAGVPTEAANVPNEAAPTVPQASAPEADALGDTFATLRAAFADKRNDEQLQRNRDMQRVRKALAKPDCPQEVHDFRKRMGGSCHRASEALLALFRADPTWGKLKAVQKHFEQSQSTDATSFRMLMEWEMLKEARHSSCVFHRCVCIGLPRSLSCLPGNCSKCFRGRSWM